MQIMEKVIEHKLIEAENELETLRDMIRFGMSLFHNEPLYYGHGTNNAYDEVVYLCLYSLNLPLEELDPYLDAKLLKTEIRLILNRFKQRVVSKLPASYITNHARLHDYDFYVDKRVIIPRSFIPELILNNDLEPFMADPDSVENILDLCTGNGSIAIIAADYFAESNVVASDIDLNALDVAKINVNKHHLNERVELVNSNLFAGLKGRKFDLILTNPPYVDQRRMSTLTKEYLFEPQHALFGGDDGLEFVQQIIEQAPEYLTDDGLLVVEMGDNAEELEALYPNIEFIWLETAPDEHGYVFIVNKQQLCSR